MVAHQIDDNGICASCSNEVKDPEVVQCYDCKVYFHGICGEVTPYCSKTFLGSFKKVKGNNFIFVSDTCITKRENGEASSINNQTSEEPVHRTTKGLVPTLKLAPLGYPLSRRQIRPHSRPPPPRAPHSPPPPPSLPHSRVSNGIKVQSCQWNIRCYY